MKNSNLKKSSKIVFVLIALSIILIIFLYLFILVNSKRPEEVNNSKELYFSNLELAITSDERNAGLMNRKSLCDDCGMLFVFENERLLTFWMKNTFISLDIIYLDESFKIVKIHKNTKTNQVSQVYPSMAKAKYVLEVNSGYSDQNNLKSGSTIELYDDGDFISFE